MTRTELGDYIESVREALLGLQQDRVAERLWAKDASLWTDSDSAAAAISKQLGWLTIVDQMEHEIAGLKRLAGEVRDSGIDTVVLLGMGGSSLGAIALQSMFGAIEGYPTLHVLDTSDPRPILDTRRSVNYERTLFLVSSKSGTTLETISLVDFFEQKVGEAGVADPGAHFVAITGAGSPLEARARLRGYRRIFTSPADIGGRYSVLSYAGLVPATFIGVDILRLLGHAGRVAAASGPAIRVAESPGLSLGAILGVLGKSGRNKVTFICQPGLEGFAQWAEHLLAESTGKQGGGLVPVLGEPPGEPEDYGRDRLFVFLRSGEADTGDLERLAVRLEIAGHPVIQCDFADAYDIGAEFMRWEIATAIAGRLLGIDPFDEPNVSENKSKTFTIISEFLEDEIFPEDTPNAVFGDIAVYGAGGGSLEETLQSFLSSVSPTTYVAFLPYFPVGTGAEAFMRIRLKLREQLGIATTLGYGPRYLHSTGQLHKGGPANAQFLILTADAPDDAAVPGSDLSFELLERAQAMGDFAALKGKGRQALRVHFRGDVQAGLAAIEQSLSSIAEIGAR